MNVKIKSVFGAVFFIAFQTHAACFYGDALFEKGAYDKAEAAYMDCARKNDASAQYRLGLLYKDGEITTGKDIEKALAFFRFSAENGYAPAQRELGALLIELEKTAQGQKTIQNYQKKALSTSEKSRVLSTIKRVDMSGYAWLLLAAEGAEHKWYYPSEALSDDKAAQMIRNKEIGETSQTTAIKEASAWKMKKLMAAAKAVLSAEEFAQFEKDVSSPSASQGTRASAVAFLKQKIESGK